jgi:hypothetical protein
MHHGVDFGSSSTVASAEVCLTTLAILMLTTTATGNEWLTARQSQRIFVEHFSWRLLQAHGVQDSFWCRPDLNSDDLVHSVLVHVNGLDRGLVAGAKSHACAECTHQKRYFSDLIAGQSLQHLPPDAVAEVDPVTIAGVSDCFMLMVEGALTPQLTQS